MLDWLKTFTRVLAVMGLLILLVALGLLAFMWSPMVGSAYFVFVFVALVTTVERVF